MKAKKLKSLLQVAANQRKGAPVKVPFVQAAVFLSKPGLHIALSDHHLTRSTAPSPHLGTSRRTTIRIAEFQALAR